MAYVILASLVVFAAALASAYFIGVEHGETRLRATIAESEVEGLKKARETERQSNEAYSEVSGAIAGDGLDDHLRVLWAPGDREADPLEPAAGPDAGEPGWRAAAEDPADRT